MRSRRRTKLAVLAAVAVVPLTACNADMVGAAAVVGDERITISELQEEAARVIENATEAGAQAPDAATLQAGMLDREVRGMLVRSVAEEQGIEVAPAEIDAAFEQQMAGLGGVEQAAAALAQAGFDAESYRVALADDMLAVAMMERDGGDAAALNEAVTARGEELGVEVNPRYGSWEQLQLIPESGSISEPVGGAEPELTPPPNG